MKKIVASLLLLGAAVSAHASSVNIQYDGSPVTKSLSLSNGDVVTINTSIPVNTHMSITMMSGNNSKNNCSHCFNSSVVGIDPYRGSNFVDSIYTGANPGWLNYIYVGDNPMKFTININR